jgi:RimJ/RimL family protein N-acetyltransferase
MNRIPFEPKHLDEIELQPHEKEMFNAQGFLQVATGTAATTYSFIHKGALIAIGGYYEKWKGVVELYIVPSVHFTKYPIAVLKETQNMYDEVTADISIHRIESACLDDPTRSRFMEYWGFKLEGTMRQYSSDKHDYCMWGWIRNG